MCVIRVYDGINIDRTNEVAAKLHGFYTHTGIPPMSTPTSAAWLANTKQNRSGYRHTDIPFHCTSISAAWLAKTNESPLKHPYHLLSSSLL
jgi:hypothetical protein